MALLALLWALLAAAPASAAAPYELDPVLSLTGDCSTSTFDPVPDPSCPYPAPPDGPSGRFEKPRAVAVDPFGNEYVASYADSEDSAGRIDVFDDEGRFITEVATPGPKSIAVDGKGHLYVFEDSGKVVRYPPSEYDGEAGKVKYAHPPVTVVSGGSGAVFVGALAVDSDDRLYVARSDNLTIYGPGEESNPVVDVVGDVGDWVEALAVDSQRNRIYLTHCDEGKIEECDVRVVAGTAPYEALEEIHRPTETTKFASPFGRMGLAVDEETGDFFVGDIINAKTVYQFNEEYEPIAQFQNDEFLANISVQLAVSNGEREPAAEPCKYPVNPAPAPGDACNRHYLFVPVLKSNGRVAAFHSPGQVPPVIEGVAAGGIGATEAELTATIFPGGLSTEYSFQITTQEAWEAETEKFEDVATLSSGTIPADSLATEVSAFATGLVPGETYRFRVTAKNELGEAEQKGQNEATFTTYEDALVSSGCPNQALRIGLSGRLPDCRAYELVTPPDTGGRPPKGVGFVGNLFTTVEASSAGDAVWFKIEGGSLSGSDGVGSFEGDPYVATRGGSGWSSELAGASGEEATVSIPGSSSPDQFYAFWGARIEGPLVINGEETQYLRYPDGHSELIGRGNEGQTDPRAEGRLITEDAAHVVFETINRPPQVAIQLDPAAPPNGTTAVYDRTVDPVTGEEETHVVSLLPGDLTPAAGQNASYVGASKDGEGIAFSIGDKLYLRVGNETTFEIGEGVEFAGVSEGGDRIFYVEGGDLEAFDTSVEEVLEFSTSGNVTPVNVATGGTRAYFVSPDVLGGANPEGAVAIPPAAGQGTLGARGTGTLATAAGTGTLTNETKEVTGVSTSEGVFQVGMQISGTGIPSGTTIASVGSGTLRLSQAATQSGSTSLAASSTKVTGVSTTQGVFQVGMQISGTGIPSGTTIVKVGSSTLTLSKAATQSVVTALEAGSTLVTDVSSSEGEFLVGMNITGSGIPAGTIIIAIDEDANTLTLSREASPTDAQSLSAFAQNLYLSEAGDISFVATVTARDVEGEVPPFEANPTDGLGLWTKVGKQLAKDPSRTTPDGSVLLFQSRAEITGYPESKSFPQIYRYDSSGGRLQCISCIPTGTAATGGANLQTITFDSLAPPPLSPSGFVPNLTPDGKRVFFDSTEALVSTDTDEVNDVYEWEEGGVGSCDRAGGCVYLISSGQSARDNFLYAHSQSGDDVFFTTEDALTDADTGGAVSIYDAKVGGGFPGSTKPNPCVADGCRPNVTPTPTFPVPVAGGEGNVQSSKKPKPCPKGKRKVKKNGKDRCVKKKQKKHKAKGGKGKQRAGANRGAGK